LHDEGQAGNQNNKRDEFRLGTNPWETLVFPSLISSGKHATFIIRASPVL